MSGFAFTPPQFTLVNSAGRPYAGAVARFYQAGTNIGLTVYADAALESPHGTSVTADGAGVFPPTFIDPDTGEFKVSFFTSGGSLIRTVDNLPVTGGGGSEAAFPVTELETAASVIPANLGYPPGNLRRYGATGLDTDEDTATAAFAAALLTGHDVSGQSGDIYWIDPVVAAIADVTIDMTGCTLKLKRQVTAPASGNYMIDVQADRVTVRGGIWDGTKSLAHIINDAYYRYAAVRLRANNCTVENIWSKDSIGIGIKGAGYDGHVVRRNRVTGWNVQGIFLENGSTAHHYDWRVEDNYVEVGTNTGVGIYLSANAPYTYYPQRWIVEGNIVIGPSTNSKADIDFASTIFGSDGVVSNNSFYGTCCGCSAVLTNNTVFIGNRFIEQNIDTPTATFGLELSGGTGTGGNTVSGNVFVGGTQGVAMNVLRPSDNNVISNNVFQNQTGQSVYILTTTDQAHYTNISNNVFTSNAATNWAAIYLGGDDCLYTLISGNNIQGSGGSNTSGVYFDNGAGKCSISNNKFNRVERPVILYGAKTYVDIMFVGNDCTYSTTSDPAALIDKVSGAAIGSNVSLVNNTVSGGGVSFDYIDRGGPIIRAWRTGTPEGVVTANVGSVFYRTDGGAGTTVYIKESGTSNTGWVGK